MKISQTVIDSFLKESPIGYGELSDKVQIAAYRAYRDFNRTLSLGESISDEKRLDLKNKVAELFQKNLIEKIESVKNQAEFDDLHKKVCDSIKEIYKNLSRE